MRIAFCGVRVYYVLLSFSSLYYQWQLYCFYFVLSMYCTIITVSIYHSFSSIFLDVPFCSYCCFMHIENIRTEVS